MCVDAVVEPEVPLMVTVNAPVVAVLLAVNVTTLLPVVGFVPNAAVTPLGKPEAARVTLPVNPPVSVTVMVSVAVAPCVTESDDADGDSVKPGVVLAATLSVMLVDAVVEPEVPLMVTVNAPVVAVLLAVNVTTLLPVVGLVPNDAVTPLGKPEAARVTLPVNPPVSVTVMVSVALAPCVTESDDADGDSVKPGVALAATVSAMLVDAVVVPEVPVMVTVDVPVVAVLLAVNVTTLLPVVGLVPNDAVTPLGKPEAARVTLPVKPPVSVTVMVSVALAPCVTDSDDADGDSVKPGVVLAATLSVMLVDAVVEPEVPLMVTVNAPVVAVRLAVNVTTLLPVVGLVPND